MIQNKKICFISLGVYPLLERTKAEYIQGPDVRALVLIRGLKRYDYELSVVTFADSDKYKEYIDTVKIINLDHVKIRKNNFILFFLDILSLAYNMLRGMQRAKADIYLHTGGAAGIASIFCKLANKKYIYVIASDALVDRTILPKENVSGFSRSRLSITTLGNWLDIKLANAVIVQTEYQKKLLYKNFGVDGILIHKPLRLNKVESQEKPVPPIVLWVGSMNEVKQPELFLEMAKEIPEAQFRMIGGYQKINYKYYERIRNTAENIANLEFLGVVPFDEIDKHFIDASVLVNTSMFEGYPTYTFVQACMYYVPIVSINDNSAEFLCKNNLGFHSRTYKQMVEDVRLLINNKKLRKQMGINGRRYVEKNHNAVNIIEDYIGVFNSI